MDGRRRRFALRCHLRSAPRARRRFERATGAHTASCSVYARHIKLYFYTHDGGGVPHYLLYATLPRRRRSLTFARATRFRRVFTHGLVWTFVFARVTLRTVTYYPHCAVPAVYLCIATPVILLAAYLARFMRRYAYARAPGMCLPRTHLPLLAAFRYDAALARHLPDALPAFSTPPHTATPTYPSLPHSPI